MQIRVRTQNVTQAELAKALTGYIVQEGLEDDVIDTLRKADKHDHDHEPIPERYMRTIVKRAQGEFRNMRLKLNNNMDKWFELLSKAPKRRVFRKQPKKRMPYVLAPDEIDELRKLIESHFKMAIGVEINLPDSMQKKWQDAGIELPQNNLEDLIADSYVAGRLQSVLENGDSYKHMMQLARQVPMSRVDELTLEAAKQNAAKYVVGYGRKMADLAEDMLVENHKSTIHDVVQRYFSGELTHTTYNAQGFTPAEVESQLATEKKVNGWRELSTELKNRFKAVDIGRDWDRIAKSETRYAANLGSLMNIQHEGGGDPEKIYVYYSVHPKACKYCKKLYLHDDGTPKLFKLSTILNNVQETGGMNVGLKASLIGETGGWIPNAILHPSCQCLIMRFIPSYAPFKPHEEDL